MDLIFAALSAALLLAVEHYFPYRQALGRKLPRLVAYVLGVLGLLIPITALLILWGDWRAVLAIWAVTLAGGAIVAICHAIDDWVDARAARREETEAVKLLREKLNDPHE